MSSQKFIIHQRDAIRRENARRAIDALSPDKMWQIEIKEYRKKRSLDQNSFLHGVPLKIICEHTGHSMDDMKQYLCGERFGWQEYVIEGRTFHKPIKTTSQLNTLEFTHFLEWVESWAAQTLGLSIPRPNEEMY